jgi:tetratricopeptide (TPR) repeat protein
MTLFDRRAFLMVCVCLAALPAAAQSPGPFAGASAEQLRRYTECMGLARRDPLRALATADAWEKQGGALAARHCRALALIEGGKHAEAAEQFESIARDMGMDRPGIRAELLAQAGQAWLASGQTAKAIAAQSKALDLKPNDPDLWVDRGLTYATSREWVRAISDFDRSLTLRPNSAETLVLRAAAWRNAGNAARALVDARQALVVAPDNTEALLERGMCFLASGDKPGAQGDFNRVLQLVPPDSAAAQRALAGLQAAGVDLKTVPAASRPPTNGQKR